MEVINWKDKEKQAKKMSTKELNYSLNDCLMCVKAMGKSNMVGKDASYYQDEASVYSQEIRARKAKGETFTMVVCERCGFKMSSEEMRKRVKEMSTEKLYCKDCGYERWSIKEF